MGLSNEPHSALKEYACNALSEDLDLQAVKGRPARNIYVVTAGAGKLRLQFADGSVESLTGLEDGTYVEPSPTWAVKVIYHAGTDCDLIRVGW